MNKGLVCLLFSLLCSLLFATPSSLADSVDGLYSSGVQLYEKNDFAKASEVFAQVLQQEPQNVSALVNLSLAQYKLGRKGAAIAHLRQALEIAPDQATAKAALRFALSQLEIKEIPHRLEAYETLRSDFLQPVSLPLYLALTALFLFAAGWTWFNYFGRRRRSLLAEEASPSFPLVSALFSVGLLALALLSVLKFYDQTLVRGTILDEKVSVQTAPGENQVVLFDLHPGFEVIVQKTVSGWVQVTYPGASTGWIKTSAILITSTP